MQTSWGPSVVPPRVDFEETADWAAMLQVKQDERRAWERVRKAKRKSKRQHTEAPVTEEEELSSETARLV